MTPGKNLALTRLTLAGKVMSLLFNMLSRLVIAFLPRNKGVKLFLVVVKMKLLWFTEFTSLLLTTVHRTGSMP